MQQVVYLIVALAVAAAILSMAVAMKAVLPPPEAPLEHAEALVYVKVKPLNGSYWLGVHAPYGDVVVRQVRVGNATYVLGVTALVGRDVWLNASGRPITAQCGDSVEVVTAKGSAIRSLSFTVQCPKVERGGATVYFGDVMALYAVNVAKYVLGFNETKITIKGCDEPGLSHIAECLEIVNISPDPLLLVFDQGGVYTSIPPRGLVPGPVYVLHARWITIPPWSTWQQHVYLSPNGSLKFRATVGYDGIISVYPAQYYYFNPANTTDLSPYLAALSPWRRVTITTNGTAAYYLNASGLPDVATEKNKVYEAYPGGEGVLFYVADNGTLMVAAPPYNYTDISASYDAKTYLGSTEVDYGLRGGQREIKWYYISQLTIKLPGDTITLYNLKPTVYTVPNSYVQYCFPSLFPEKRAVFNPVYYGPYRITIEYGTPKEICDPSRSYVLLIYDSVMVKVRGPAFKNAGNNFTYYASNHLYAYNYELKIYNETRGSCTYLVAELYRLGRLALGDRNKTLVKKIERLITCTSGSGSSSSSCGPPTPQYYHFADIKTAGVKGRDVTFTFKAYYRLVDCNGNVLGTGYNVLTATVTAQYGNLYVRDVSGSKVCPYTSANQDTTGKNQMILTC